MPETLITEALQRLETWIESQAFKGWDPFDALNSPLLKHLVFGNRRLGQVWVQTLKRSPLNFRHVLGVPKGYNPKAMGLFLASYIRKYLRDGRLTDLERVRFFQDWLSVNVSPGYSGACWGYNFDWPNRSFFAPAGTPTAVNTAFIGMAFLDMVELTGSQGALDSECQARALELARSACNFMVEDLNRSTPTDDEFCFSYTPLDKRYVHNANVLGACLLARVAARTDEPELRRVALASSRYTARRLRPEGYWPYGEGKEYTWVDNFHTGYVLVALREISRTLETDEFKEAIHRGYAYWKAHFFTEKNAPKYYPTKVFPIDVHSAAQAILTFLEFAAVDSQARDHAYRVAKWVINNMQDPDGYFHYQIHSGYRIRIPYMRWSQAWMHRALTGLMFSCV
jgi:hypothetical protein